MKKNILIASGITILIIAILLLSGPAQAFVINLIDFNNINPEKGTIVSTNIELKILTNERMTLSNPAKVYIDNVLYCDFDVDDVETLCDDMIIKRISSLDNSKEYGYGYGYGTSYGYGYQNGYHDTVLNFTLTLNTSDLSIGSHAIKITLDAGEEHIYSSEIKSITVKDKSTTSNIVLSGSSGSTGTCLTNWTCSSWSTCVNGSQIRTCIKGRSYCYAKPLNLKQNCSTLLIDDTLVSPLDTNVTSLNNDEDMSIGFFGRIAAFFNNIWNWIFNRNSGSVSR